MAGEKFPGVRVMVERIIAAARASFAHNGWAGTTMRAIAREVDVDPAVVHYYFASKEDLLDAAAPAARLQPGSAVSR